MLAHCLYNDFKARTESRLGMPHKPNGIISTSYLTIKLLKDVHNAWMHNYHAGNHDYFMHHFS